MDVKAQIVPAPFYVEDNMFGKKGGNLFGEKGSKSVTMSTGKNKVVCGYEIKQMPVGAYLKAIKRIEDAPADFLAAVFPGKGMDEVLEELMAIDYDGVKELISGVALKAPEYVIALVSELSGIDEDKLLNDPHIGLHGLLEIIEVMIEVNRLGECIASLKNLKSMMVK